MVPGLACGLPPPSPVVTATYCLPSTLNVTGYWTQIRDYQAIVNNQSTSTLRGYLANAGKVRVRGIEADFSVRPSDRFNLYVNGAFSDARYLDFKNAPCPPELSGGPSAGVGGTPGPAGVPGAASPLVCDISGQWMPGISKFAFSYGGEYNLPGTVLGNPGEAYVGVDANSRTKFSSNASRSIYTDIPGYTADGWATRQFSESGFFDPDKPIKKYTKAEREDFLYKEPTKVKINGVNLTYEGLVPKIQKSMLSKDLDALQPHIRAFVERAATFTACVSSGGV